MDDEHRLERPVILIADDDEVIRTLLHRYVRILFSGVYILEAGDGEETLSLAFAWKPDAVIMNINIPLMDGLEATRRINAVMPDIRVVIISLDENEQYRDRALSAGADAYILESGVAAELVPVLKKLLSVESREDRVAALAHTTMAER